MKSPNFRKKYKKHIEKSIAIIGASAIPKTLIPRHLDPSPVPVHPDHPDGSVPRMRVPPLAHDPRRPGAKRAAGRRGRRLRLRRRRPRAAAAAGRPRGRERRRGGDLGFWRRRCGRRRPG